MNVTNLSMNFVEKKSGQGSSIFFILHAVDRDRAHPASYPVISMRPSAEAKQVPGGMFYSPQPRVEFKNTRSHSSILLRVCSSRVVEALCYKPEGRGFDSRSSQ
jgi:hypothetical protein